MRSSRYFVAPSRRVLPNLLLLVVFACLGQQACANALPPLVGVTRIAAGQEHACSLDGDAVMKCWGSNQYGQLGDGSVVDALRPQAVGGLGGDVVAIAAGGYHACAVLIGGTVKCWGRNDQGQLGNNSNVSISTPVDVQGLTGVLAIAAGDDHSCALTDAGAVKCWGRNDQGQLGNGSGVGSLVPVDVTGLGNGSGVSEIGITAGHTCAVVGGGLKCWGRNDVAQLGDNSTTNRLSPVDTIAPGSGVNAVAMGAGHSCARFTGGTLSCWGDNNNGQHGDGTGVFHMTPSPAFGGGGGFTLVDAGHYHTCAANAGGILCAGYGPFGQLGDGGVAITQPNPVSVAGINGGVSALALGTQFSCALLTDTTVMCWGRNNAGQLGNGTRTDATMPVDVVERDAARQVGLVSFASNGASVMPRTDASGRYVVFQSSASNLLGGGADSNGNADVFRLDSVNGTFVRASVNNDGSQLAGESMEAAVSADGSYVVFVAPNAVMTKLWGESAQDTAKQRKQGGFGVFLRNLLTGTTQRVGDATSTGTGTAPAISPQGDTVVFTATNTDPGMGAMGQENVFVVPFQRVGNALMAGTTSCVSCKSRSAMGAAVGDADGVSRNAVVSGDGHYVAYETLAKNATAGTPAPCTGASTAEIMLRDLLTGSTQRISPSPTLPPANCGAMGSVAPSIDWSGRVVAFASDSALTAGAIGGTAQVFRTAPGDVAPLRLSETAAGVAADAAAHQPVISGDGQTAAFVSAATNLDDSFTDTNGWADIHVQRRGRTGGPQRLSKSTLGFEANQGANHPTLNYNGTRVLFDSAASNLVPNDGNGSTVDVFQRALPLTAELVYGAGFE